MALVMTGYGGPTGEDIGKLISNEMSHDEKHKNFLENLATGGNGKYIPSAPRIKERKTVPLPEAINHQYSDVKSRSFRGLFPEINRAYITLDSKLVLWNYFEGNQFTEYTKLDQIICAVGLMKPKPGIFVDKVKYVLVVATTVEIVMLGCVFDEDLVHGMITLYETQFYATTDDVVIEKIIGTNAGRIFMCGKDGCVYELHYQAQDGWFSRKCRKLNHSQGKMRTFLPEFLFGGQEDPIIDIVVDESRNLLFTLSQSSRAHTISAWSLGDDGMGMTFWARNATVNSDFSRELRLVSDNQTSNLKLSLVSLATIPRPESEKIVLSAISDNGSRLFFSLDENGYMGRRNLSLKFVRLCPPAIKNDHSKNIAKDPSYISASSPLGVSRAFYNKGVLLLGCSNDSSGALVVAVMQKKASCNPIESLLNESVETLPSPKIMDVHAIAEVPIELYSQGGHLYASSSFRAPLAGLDELATQHALPPRLFVCFSNIGVQYFEKIRPRDELAELLRSNRDLGHDNNSLGKFFQDYGAKEARAMCLIIACSNQVSSLDASVSIHSPGLVTARQHESISQLAATAFFNFGFSQHRAAGFHTDLKIVEGVALYMSRILRPLWNFSLMVEFAPGKFRLRFSKNQLRKILLPLVGLECFMKDQKNFNHFEMVLPKPGVDRVAALRDLLIRSVEAVRLLLVVESQGAEVFAKLPHTVFEQLVNPNPSFRFNRLVIMPIDIRVVQALIGAVLDPMGKASDSIILTLSQECPQFFGETDRLQYEALHKLKLATEQKGGQRNQLQERALDMYKTSAGIPNFDIKDISKKLRSEQFYTGAVKLALHRLDLLNKGKVDFPHSSGHFSPSVGNSRKDCFTAIIETLDALKFPYDTSGTARDPNSAAQLDNEFTSVLLLCLQGRSENTSELHEKVYAWLLARTVTLPHVYELPRALCSSSLEPYLRQINRLDILKDYFNNNAMYREAGDLLWDMSRAVKSPVGQRLDNVRQALEAYRLCVDNPDVSQRQQLETAERLQHIQFTEKILFLQHRLYSVLSRKFPLDSALDGKDAKMCTEDMDIKRLEKDIEDLNEITLEVPDLWTLASLYELYAMCLSIIHFDHAVQGNHIQEEEVICGLWKNVIRQEVKVNRNTWNVTVPKLLKELFDEFQAAQFMCPIKFILQTLEDLRAQFERKGMQFNADKRSFVVDAMKEAGIDCLQLKDGYSNMLHERAFLSSSEEARKNILLSVCYLVEQFVPDRARVDSLLLHDLSDLISQCQSIALSSSLLCRDGGQNEFSWSTINFKLSTLSRKIGSLLDRSRHDDAFGRHHLYS